jgi:hypothetical protein
LAEEKQQEKNQLKQERNKIRSIYLIYLFNIYITVFSFFRCFSPLPLVFFGGTARKKIFKHTAGEY